MQIAGIILCGGLSTRMGAAKASLPFGPETLLQRAVRIVASVAQPVVVVAARRQSLPTLQSNVRLVYDRHEGRGPLEGMLAGLTAVTAAGHPAFVCGCDTPLLTSQFIEHIANYLGDNDVAVPQVDGFYHPLSAVYRGTVTPHIEALLNADRRGVFELFEQVHTRKVTADELRVIDPSLASLRNVNTPEEYQAALAAAGQGG